MADSACYVELASTNGEFFTNSLVDDIMIRPQYATQKILIGTSNGLVPSLTVTSNNVGIGTTTPGYKLDISGDINFTGSLLQNGTAWSSGSGSSSQWSNNSTNVFLLGSNVGIGTSAPTEKFQVSSGKIYSDTQILSTSNDSVTVPAFSFKENSNTGIFHAGTDSLGFTTGGNERLRIDSTGNVGLGSTNPSYKLDVNGVIRVANGILMNQNDDTYIGISATNSAPSLGLIKKFASLPCFAFTSNYGNSTSANAMFFGMLSGSNLAGVSACNLTTYMTLDASGSLGIGTTSPAYKLDVNGTIKGTNYILPHSAWITSADSVNRLFFAANARSYYRSFDGQEWRSSNDGTLMVLTNGGNLGIGTTSPSYKLDVDGTINSSGNLTGPTVTSLSNLGLWTSNNMFNKAGGTITGTTLLYQGSPVTLSNTSLASSYPLVLQSSSGTNGITNGLAFMNTTATPSEAVPGALILLERMGGAGRGMLHFATKNGTTNTSSCDIRMSITPDGKVGIGTSNPSATLSVNNNAGQGPTLVMTFENSTNTNKLGVFVNLTGGNYNGCVATGDTAIISGLGASDSGSLVLGVWGNSNAGVKIDKTGYVGVGTASPAYKLDVNGTTRIKGTGTNGASNLLVLENQAGARIQFVDESNAYPCGMASYGTGNGIGIYAGSTIGFYTSNASSSASLQRMTITQAGDVGIGNTSPAYKLDVNGTGRSTLQVIGNGTTTSLNGAPTTSGMILTSSTNGTMAGPHIAVYANNSTYPIYQQLNWAADNVAHNYDSYFDGNNFKASGTSASFQIYKTQNKFMINYAGASTAGTTIPYNSGLVMDSSGNVGIGTTSPGYKLDVNGVIRVANGILMNSNDDTYIGINAASTAASLGLVKKSGYFPHFAFTSNAGGLTTANAMYFGMLSGSNLAAVSACNLTTYMTLDNAGNLGIGTTTPAYKLDVNGDIRAGNNGCLISGTTSGFLRMVGTGNATYIQSGLTNANNSAAPLVFGTMNSATEWARFDNAGNLGIGTTTPSAKLHVVGNSILNGGNQICVQNGQDGGTGRGIYMYSVADTNWGIYMGQSGATKSLAGATAVAGYGFNSYATRIRVSSGATTGFILENISEALLMSVRGSDGLTYIAGNTTLNNTTIGNAGHGAGYAAFAHSNVFNTSSYGLLQDSGGTTFLNCASARSILFRENNSDIVVITGSKMGVLTSSPSYQLHVVGTIYATGDIIGFSDKRLKSNITIIDSALSKIHKLNGYTFNLQDDEKTHTGLIAQEVLEVLPEAVHQEKKADGTDGYYSLAYGNMAGLFVEAIKEIDNKYKSQITELQETVSILKQEIDMLKNKI